MEDKPKSPENQPAIATKFDPSPEQVKFLEAAINVGTYKNKTSVSEQAGVDRSCWYKWLKKAGFVEWFYTEFNKAISFRVFELDMICYNKANEDFRYMELLQKKYGGLPVGNSSIKVDVKANANAEAKTEVELGTEEAKERLSRNLGIMQRYGYLPEFVSED